MKKWIKLLIIGVVISSLIIIVIYGTMRADVIVWSDDCLDPAQVGSTPIVGGVHIECVISNTPTPTATATNTPIPTNTPTPSSIPLPIILLEADKDATQMQGGGGPISGNNDPVGHWVSQTGSTFAYPGKHTDFRRPILRTNFLNGLPIIEFDNDSDVLAIDNPMSNGDEGTIFLLFQPYAQPPKAKDTPFRMQSGDATINPFNGHERIAIENRQADGTLRYEIKAACGVNCTNTWQLVDEAYSSDWRLLTFAWSVSNDNLTVRINGQAIGIRSGLANWLAAPNEILLGAKAQGGADSSAVRIATFRLYDTPLDESQMVTVENEISNKWGVP